MNETSGGTTDWRTMDAEHLTRYLWERLGWKKHVYAHQRYAHYDWVNPQGQIEDREGYGGTPPDYAEDTDDALLLFEAPLRVSLLRYYNPPNWIAEVWSADDEPFSEHPDTYPHLCREMAATPAHAICRAYLTWKDLRP